MKTKEELQKEIKHLKETIKRLSHCQYIHEINTISASDGELYLSYGDPHKEKHLVFNAENLFNDLALIISLTVKENEKMKEMHLKHIKEAVSEIK